MSKQNCCCEFFDDCHEENGNCCCEFFDDCHEDQGANAVKIVGVNADFYWQNIDLLVCL